MYLFEFDNKHYISLLYFFLLYTKQSLGKVDQGPHIGKDNMVTITYTNGDQCDTDHTKNLTSTVSLQCTKGMSAVS